MIIINECSTPGRNQRPIPLTILSYWYKVPEIVHEEDWIDIDRLTKNVHDDPWVGPS